MRRRRPPVSLGYDAKLSQLHPPTPLILERQDAARLSRLRSIAW